MMSRVYNFCAGPAALPEPVLAFARDELLSYQGMGLSVMEMSHRSPEFEQIVKEAEASLRRLLSISDDYHVLFMQGGATLQFSLIPMNLLRGKKQADYLVTGTWSEKALEDASRLCRAHCVASNQAARYTNIPDPSTWQLSSPDQSAYLHYCPNETIVGVEFPFVPDVALPLVADMSSTLLSRPIDVSRFGLIYAGAQKNIGPAGLVIVIVRKDWVGDVIPGTPQLLNYQEVAKQHSMINTPPSFSIYLAGLVFRWLEAMGGVSAIAAVNERKAMNLYRTIDESEFYHNPVEKSCRSWMNVPFTLKDEELDVLFLKQADQLGLKNLKGHRLVGGMRASLYNAVPEEGVAALIAFMKAFAQKHG